MRSFLFERIHKVYLVLQFKNDLLGSLSADPGRFGDGRRIIRQNGKTKRICSQCREDRDTGLRADTTDAEKLSEHIKVIL